MNFIDFCKFLLEVNGNTIIGEYFFTIEKFAIWQDKSVDVELKIHIANKYNCSFECKLPYFEKWITIYKESSLERLYKVIFSYGLQEIFSKYKEYYILYQIITNKSMLLVDKETSINPKYSIFQYENDLPTKIKIWTYTKDKSEVISRIGRDNLIHSEIYTKHYIVFYSEVIEDEYLYSLVPNEQTIFEDDKGYIPSMSELITENVTLNTKITESFAKKYDSLLHYKFLIDNKKRQIREFDNILYKTLIKSKI